MARPLSLALVQADAPSSLHEFGERMRTLSKRHPGTRLFVFPENHIVPALDSWRPETVEAGAEPLDGPTASAVCDVARELGVWIIPGSMLERAADGRIFNTLIVVAPDGSVAATYRKVFPWRPVEQVAPGDEFVTFDMPGVGRIGLSVCYDAWFPEVSRQLAWMGAEVIVNVVLTPTSDRNQEVTLVHANAIVNQVFVASVNAAAPRGAGQSVLVDPQGRTLDRAAAAEPIVLAATIDLDEVTRTRAHGTADVTRPWSQFTADDAPIELPVYGGRIDPRTWNPGSAH